MLDSEITLIFIACNVGEAQRAEELLTRNDIDYCLSFEPFLRAGPLATLLGTSESIGVGFSVISGQAAFSRNVLLRYGLRTGIVD